MYHGNFQTAIDRSLEVLVKHGMIVDPGRWQGIETTGKPDLETLELLNLQLEVPVSNRLEWLQLEIEPSLPWADLEFEERVGGTPRNPHQSLTHWPWWHGQEGLTMYDGMFTHTYSERFWPPDKDGIHYAYGDLNGVVDLLVRNPHTRQATFPIFFPEDTGAVHGGRIPCTLHYHFLLRGDLLHMWYAIRSCDAVRHFRDDLYMACRLLLWVIQACGDAVDEDTDRDDFSWHNVRPGTLNFTAYSFHIHKGDLHRVLDRPQ
jgi:hypothetical protein